MSDLISREQALDAFKYDSNLGGYDTIMLYEVQSAIECLPSIDAEPVRHGHWDFNYGNPLAGNFVCSECLEEFDQCTYYCPNCGAKMDEELSELLVYQERCPDGVIRKSSKDCYALQCHGSCENCWLDWLKQEAEDG